MSVVARCDACQYGPCELYHKGMGDMAGSYLASGVCPWMDTKTTHWKATCDKCGGNID